MQTIQLKPLQHREQECIGIYFENSPAINDVIRKYTGARWSRTKKVWYLPLNKQNYNKLSFALKEKATIEQQELHDYLAAKKKKELFAVKSFAGSNVMAKEKLSDKLIKTTDTGSTRGAKQQLTIYKGAMIHAINAMFCLRCSNTCN